MVEKNKNFNIDIDTQEMIRAGVHFGHRRSRVHPKIKPYLSNVRNEVHILDVEKTAEKLKEACEFIYNLIKEDKILLFVGTKIQVKKLVEEAAQETDLPYVNERWLGGTFTNFETMSKRIDYFKSLEAKMAAGEFEKYTKKEQAKIEKEINDLRRKLGGIKSLTKLPEAVFVVDMKKDELAVKEARSKNIKVVGIVDTNVDPTLANFPIPANDDAIPAIKYILDKVVVVIKKAQKDKNKEKNKS